MIMFLSMLDTAEEQEIFVALYNKYRYLMWYIANDMLKDAQLAEDAVQEAFLSVTKHINKIQDVGNSKTKKFLLTIVKNKSIDIIRKNGSTKYEDWEENDRFVAKNSPDLLDDYITKDNYSYLLKCIANLSEIYKIVFEYKYLHQLTDGEIADLLNVSKKVVNVRVYRARKQLQEMLEKEILSHEQ